MTRVLSLGAALSAVLACAQSAPPADAWKPLEFLVGTWEAKTQGGSAAAAVAGSYTFQFDLRRHVLVRRTATADCKGPKEYDCEHSDLLYIYAAPDAKTFKAIYFDNEGHTIQYDLSTPTPGAAVFVSTSPGVGPQYRLSYQLKGSVMEGAFEMRPPGKSEFQPYLRWSGRKL